VTPDFEYDPAKSESNKAKHNIDFEEAQQLWLDPRRIIIPANSEDEPRYVLIGKIGEKHWSAVYTPRDGKIRLISVRRSRDKERKLYES